MSKLIRFDEDHYGYLSSDELPMREMNEIGSQFTEGYPGKRLIVMQADEFIDLTGQYEIVPIREAVA